MLLHLRVSPAQLSACQINSDPGHHWQHIGLCQDPEFKRKSLGKLAQGNVCSVIMFTLSYAAYQHGSFIVSLTLLTANFAEFVHCSSNDCHTHHTSMTDFRPIYVNTMTLPHMTSS